MSSYRKALEIAEPIGDGRLLGEIWANLAVKDLIAGRSIGVKAFTKGLASVGKTEGELARAQYSLGVGRLYSRTNHLGHAESYLKDGLCCAGPGLSPEVVAQGYVDLGNVMMAKRRFPEAWEEYRQAMQLASEPFVPRIKDKMVLAKQAENDVALGDALVEGLHANASIARPEFLRKGLSAESVTVPIPGAEGKKWWM